MYSTIAKANYEYVDMKIKDLRDRIFAENDLDIFKIMRGYHEKSSFNCFEYKNILSDEDTVKLDKAKQILLDTVAELGPNLAQELYDSVFNEYYPHFAEVIKKAYPDKTPEDFLTDEDWLRQDRNKESAVIGNAIWELLHHLEYRVYRCANNPIQKTITEVAQQRIDKEFGEGLISLDSQKTLPTVIDLNTLDFESDVFKDIYYKHSIDSMFGLAHEYIKLPNRRVHHGDDKISITVPDLYIKLSKETIVSAVETVVREYVDSNNNISAIEYMQNIEAQPITVNMNTKTGRCELIDGYKRLLYTPNHETQEFIAPVRVFTDLDDYGFLALLYSANMWKTLSMRSYHDMFHDRGYLFALKCRYGFEIPAKHYKESTLGENELTAMYIYDFVTPESAKGRRSIWKGIEHKSHLVNDLTYIYNNLYDLSNEDHGYDNNIAVELRKFIIAAIGCLRDMNFNGHELSDELIRSIYTDKQLIKFFTNKHLSTDTYIKNYFERKGVYKIVIDILKEGLK